MELLDFYKGKRVLVTGDTGFKGSWLVRILHLAGAEVTGYALKAPTSRRCLRSCIWGRRFTMWMGMCAILLI